MIYPLARVHPLQTTDDGQTDRTSRHKRVNKPKQVEYALMPAGIAVDSCNYGLFVSHHSAANHQTTLSLAS